MWRTAVCTVLLTLTTEHSGILGSKAAFPCPDASAIQPCVCKNSDTSMDLDCSKVTSDSELAAVFRADFPVSTFRDFSIEENIYIHKLSNIFRGISFSFVYIYNTTLHTITEDAFDDSVDTLESLTIHYSSISNEEFGLKPWKFPLLTTFGVEGSALTSVPLLNSSSITVAFFYDNRISALTAGFIKETPNITHVAMSQNNITSLSAHAFDLPPRHMKIELDHNRISSVAVEALALPPDTKELKLTLSLTNNSITTLDESVYGPVFPFLTTMYLENNPLACECDVAWIVLKTAYLYKVSPETTCADGRTFRTLDPLPFEEYC